MWMTLQGLTMTATTLYQSLETLHTHEVIALATRPTQE